MFSLSSTQQCCSYKLLYLHVCDILHFILRHKFSGLESQDKPSTEDFSTNNEVDDEVEDEDAETEEEKEADESTYETEEEPTTETESEDDNRDNHQPRR